MAQPVGTMRRDLTGQRFGKLVAVRYIRATTTTKPRWECVCDCGKTHVAPPASLTSGNTRSCGCLHRQQLGDRARRHGKRDSAEYATWCAMKDRCHNPESQGYRKYGARGITVCPAWRDSFDAFFAHVGPKPSPEHTIDRYPNSNGNYEPGNVRWATKREQAQNTSRNVLLEFRGERLCVAEWARRLELAPSVISTRLRLGWSVEETLTKAAKPCS